MESNPPMDPVKESSLDEIAELKHRLAEAEAALKALSGTDDPARHQPSDDGRASFSPPIPEYYRNLFYNMTEGCALHEIVCNEAGEPSDYRFLEVNPAFERITGIQRENAIGRLASEIIPGLEPFWIHTYGDVALNGHPVQFDRYTHYLDRYFRVYAYSPAPRTFAAIFIDITDQKLVELQLNEIADKYFTLFNTTSDGVWIHDLDGIILEVNDAYCQMSGYARDELINMPISLLEAIETPEQVRAHIQKLLSQEGHDRFESRHRRKNGTLIDVDVTALYYDLEGGRIAIFVRDITERKRAEERLAYLASFPERNPNPVLEVDLHGQILYTNPVTADLLPDLRQRGLDHPFLAGLESIVRTLLDGHTSIHIRDVAFSDRTYQQSLFFLPDEKLIRIYATDITERKQWEDALRKSKQRLSRAQELAHLGSWELDLTTNHLTWTDEVYRIFGYQPNEFPATYEAFLASVHPDDRAAVDEAYSGSIRDGRDAYEIDHRVINHATGEVRFVHEKCYHFRDESGNIIRSEGMVHDITERKLIDHALRKAHDELEIRVQERTSQLEITNEKLHAEVTRRQQAQAELEASLQELQIIEEELRKNNETLVDTQQVMETERQRYQDLFDHSPDGYLVTDPYGTILQANHNAARLLQTGIRYLTGKPLQVFIASSDQVIYEQILTSLKHQRGIESHELKMLTRNASLITSAVMVTYNKNESGEDTLRWTLRDISEYKRAEEIIRQNSLRNAVLSEVSQSLSEASLDENAILDIVVKATARLIGDGSVITLASPDGEWLEPVAWWHKNPEALELMSRLYASSRHPSSEGPSSRVYTTTQPLLIKKFEAPFNPANVSSVYREYTEKVGLSSLLIVPMQIGSQTIGTFGLSRDSGGEPYTEDDQTLLEILANRTSQSIHNARLYQELQDALRNELETHDQLVQAEKFAAVGRLLASITHEINNPLQTIKNCLYLSQADIDPTSVINEYLRMATSETDRLSNLVAQLREIYRPPTRGQFKPVILPELLADVRTLLAGYLNEKNVTWSVSSLDPSFFATQSIEAMPEQLKQVFLNLSLNAIDAMEPLGGDIHIELKMSAENQEAGIRFGDNGPGLPEEVKDRLFEPFITTKEKGLGLGLVICYDIVQKHNGHIEVESEPGKGTAFTVWLPMTKTPGQQA